MFRLSLCLVLVLAANLLTAQTNISDSSADSGAGITVRNWVDKTALFPGDRVTYHVEVICDSGIGILAEDLGDDELVLSGLEVISSILEETGTGGKTRYHATYLLTTYETGGTPLRVNELRVRYYNKRPGQRIEDVATVGEVPIPAVSLVPASTLPGALNDLELRDTGRPYLIAKSGMAGWIGLFLVLLSGIPLGRWVFSRAVGSTIKIEDEAEPGARTSIPEMEDIGRLDATDPEQRRYAFERLEVLVKTHIQEAWDVSAMSLTPSEIVSRLDGTAANVADMDLERVLVACEQVRYGRPEDLPEANDLEQGISIIRQFMTRS